MVWSSKEWPPPPGCSHAKAQHGAKSKVSIALDSQPNWIWNQRTRRVRDTQQRRLRAPRAVGILQEQRPVAFCRVLGPDGNEVRGEFHLAILQINCVGQIDDALIVNVGNGHCEVDAAADAFVRTALTEGIGV